MDKMRVRYSKTGRASYISHLDLVTTMQRAFIRAGVALKYSEGFNPHPHISIALPASVGIESQCEIMDVSLSGGGIPSDVNSFLPDGIKISASYRPWRKIGDIKWLETENTVSFDDDITPEYIKLISDVFKTDSIMVTKKTKRGITTLDIAPYICDVSVSQFNRNSLLLTLKHSAQEPTINHKDIAAVLSDIDTCQLKLNNIKTKRIELYDKNMLLFK